MKKRFVFLLLVCSIFFGSFISNVRAVPNNIKIIRVDVGSSYKTIYSENDDDFDEVEGVSFDVDSNTLTFTNHKNDYEFSIRNMGTTFKIKLVGDNDIKGLDVHNTTLNIIGDGTLTVNKERTNTDVPISLYESKLIVDNTVTFKAYTASDSYFEEHPDEPQYVIGAISYDNLDKSDVITFKGINNDEIKTEIRYDDINVTVYGYYKTYDVTPKTVTLVYDYLGYTAAMFLDDGPDTSKYRVLSGDIVTDENNNYYYINERDTITSFVNDYYHGRYPTLDDLKERYSMDDPPKEITLTHVIDVNDYLRLRYGSDSKRYAVSNVSGDDSVYSIKDESITLTNRGKQTKWEKIELITSNPPSSDELSSPTEPYYVYFIEGNALLVEPKPKEETSNPDTGDNIYIYVCLLIASSYVLIKRKSLMN